MIKKKLLFTLLPTCLFANLYVAISSSPLNSVQSSANRIEFIENLGQLVDENRTAIADVQYYSFTPGMDLYFSANGVGYVFRRNSEESVLASEGGTDRKKASGTTETYRMDMVLIGANRALKIVAEDISETYTNYYLGHCPDGLVNVHQYRKLVYKEVYPHIDLVFYTVEKGLKYDFVVYPGGDPADIGFTYNGASSFDITDNGNIHVVNPVGSMDEFAPYAFQLSNNTKTVVECNFKKTARSISFDVADYNPLEVLVIDPNLIWGSYFGGTSNFDQGYGVAADNNGSVCIIGKTASTSGVSSVGVHQTSHGGGTYDVFVSKFNSNGTLAWATYYGGTGTDDSYESGITTDASGNIYITGLTYSTTAIATAGTHKSTMTSGVQDAFLVKFNSAGIRQWGTYFGSDTNNDEGADVEVDVNGNVFIVGTTGSSANVATGGSHQTNFGGGYDVYLAKFNSSDGTLFWATYYGGSGWDYGYGVSSDINGNIYVTGVTQNTAGNIIVTNGAHQTAFGGSTSDAFLVKFNSAGVRQWGTYYGGNANETGSRVDNDMNGGVYLLGYTESPDNIATVGAHMPNYAGNTDAFLAKFDTAGVRLWGTYFGGSLTEYGVGLGVEKICGVTSICFSGRTNSTSGISTAGSYQSTKGGLYDSYLVIFDSAGVQSYGTYYGGTNDEFGYNIAVNNNNIYIVGVTYSTTAIATSGAYQQILGGSQDAFIARFAEVCLIPPIANFSAAPTGICIGQCINFIDASTNNPATWEWTFQGASPATSSSQSPSNICYNSPGNYTVTLIVGNTYGSDTLIQNSFITVNTPPSINFTPPIPATCSGDTILITANSTGSTFEWSTGATTGSVSVSPASDSVFFVTATNNGCIAEDSVLVTVKPSPQITITNDTSVCFGNLLTLTANASGSSFLWSTGDTSGNLTVSPFSDSVFFVTATNNGCASFDSVQITLQPSPQITLSDDTSVCSGNSLQLTAASTANSFLWSTGDTLGTITVVPSTDSAFFVTVTDNGCSTEDSVMVFVQTTPLVSLISDTGICSGNSLQLSAIVIPPTTGVSYLWSNGNTSPSFTIVPVVTSTYSVTVSTPCGSILESVNVIVFPAPVANAGNDTTIALGSSATLNANFTSAISSFQWNTGENSNSILVSPVESTVYFLTVTDASGCSDVDSVMVFTDDSQHSISVTNIFSPNGDGKNDFIYVHGYGIREFKLVIYNRWGEEVFQTSDRNIGWDGKFKGKPLNSSVFVYTLESTFNDNTKFSEKGNITLVR